LKSKGFLYEKYDFDKKEDKEVQNQPIVEKKKEVK
jgi:hypothetical protein